MVMFQQRTSEGDAQIAVRKLAIERHITMDQKDNGAINVENG